MMKPSSDTLLPNVPVDIKFERWKHRSKGTIVTVYGVHNFRGKHGFYSVVEVCDKEQRIRQWPVTVFLRTFRPFGRKKLKDGWDLIREGLQEL